MAKKIISTPKQDRRDLLNQEQADEQYWQARQQLAGTRQVETEIDGGLGVLLDKRFLYHGSPVDNISQFNEAEETTIGTGVYLTSQADIAIGYARLRANHRKGKSPVIYEVEVNNLKILDLRKNDNVVKILQGFKLYLADLYNSPNQPRRPSWQIAIRRAINTIESHTVNSGNLRKVTFNTSPYFSEYIQSLGYDGLVAFEGGEGDTVGDHDSYVIFNPANIRVNRRHMLSQQ